MKTLLINERPFNISAQEEVVSSVNLDKVNYFFIEWLTLPHQEQTWVKKQFGLQSIAVSVDFYARDENFILSAINPNPRGLGVAAALQPKVSRLMQEKMRSWPSIYVTAESLSDIADDFILLHWSPKEKILKSDGLIWPRLKANDPDREQLSGRSVCPLLLEGDNSYGESLGLWRPVSYEDLRAFDWENGFCLIGKNSRRQNFEIWHPERRELSRNHIGGPSTKSRIERILQQEGEMYYRYWLDEMGGVSFLPTLFRIFFLYDCRSGKYQMSGGIWIRRRNLRLREAADAMIGPLLVTV